MHDAIKMMESKMTPESVARSRLMAEQERESIKECKSHVLVRNCTKKLIIKDKEESTMPLTIVSQDITKMDVDAIVNAANTAHRMGAGR
jgi:hypothetical protein